MRAMACKAAVLCLLCLIVSASSLSGSPRRLLQQANPEHSRNILQDAAAEAPYTAAWARHEHSLPNDQSGDTSVDGGGERSLLDYQDPLTTAEGVLGAVAPFVPLLLLKTHKENITIPEVTVDVDPNGPTTVTAPLTNVKANGKRRLKDAGAISVNAGGERSLLDYQDPLTTVEGALGAIAPFVPLLLLKAHEENDTVPGDVAVGVDPAASTTVTAPFPNVKANGKRRLRDAGATSVNAGGERSLLDYQDPLTTVEGALGAVAPFVPLLLLKANEETITAPGVVAEGVDPAAATAPFTNVKANDKRRLRNAGDTSVSAGGERSLLDYQDPLTTVEGVLGAVAPFVPLLLLKANEENITAPGVVAVGVDPAAATTVTAPLTNVKANGKRRLLEEVSVTGPLGVTVHLDTASGNGTVTAPYTTVDFGRRLQQQAGDRGRQ